MASGAGARHIGPLRSDLGNSLGECRICRTTCKCYARTTKSVAEAGVEHFADSPRKTNLAAERAAFLRAFGLPFEDGELIEVVNAWANLTREVKASILAIVAPAASRRPLQP